MIYQKVNFDMFKTAFDKVGRGNQFSEDGLKMLYDWLDNGEHDIELDAIASSCQYVEYTKEDFLSEFGLEEDINSIDSLKQALVDDEIDFVISYHIDKDIILVNGVFC